MTDDLKFSQAYIGILGSIGAAGWVTGALLYRRFFDGLTLKNLLNLSIALGTVTARRFLFFWNETAAAIISFCAGFSAMLATVATLTLAADYCPRRAEGFSFAVLMSIINLATTLADNVGSFLYTHVFNNGMPPLILISAAFTAFAFVLVPLLRLGRQAAGRACGNAGKIGTARPRCALMCGFNTLKLDGARIMRKVGAFFAIAAIAAISFSPPPAAAFGLRIGPFRIGVPFYFPRYRHHLYMHANPNDMPRPGQPQQPDVTSALLYPNLALPAIFQSVFWPSDSSPWPFGYQDIFSTAFAKPPASADQRHCQPSVDANAIVGRIRDEVSPTADQMKLLQKLGGALGAAAGYLAKSCPNEIPDQPIARLQLMESQIEELAMAIDIVRQPLQDFEQSLNSAQQAKFAAVGAAAPAADRSNQTDSSVPTCGGSPAAIDSSIDQIDKTVQTDRRAA